MRRTLQFFLVAVAVVAVASGIRLFQGSGVAAEPTATAADVSAKYHCPMHPSYVSDTPGSCPICGMKLVRTERPGAGPPAAAPPHAGHEGTLGPADRARVTLAPERLQMLGIRSEPVAVVDLTTAIRTVGRVTVDERRVHHVHTKFEGYVETLHVDFVGKRVRRGQPLASIFSPELVATQEEYLLALRARQGLGASQISSVVKGSTDLLDAARRRLLLWDIPPATIDRLERTGEVRRSLNLNSPVTGYVVAKAALHGMRVMPSDALFDIADLSQLWVLADVYEQDLASVRVGARADLSVTYLPGRVWAGSVTWIAPMVEATTRTVKVRVELDNADGQLKPEMFADVALRTPDGRALMVPEAAVIRSGERDLVFVDEGEGRFAPREVGIGRKGTAGFEVKSGLAEGERVVTSANFLLDSESSLKAALAAMSRPTRGPGAPGTGASTPPSGHKH
jgi:membrane fusion protein, copper/silver efflux system